jgi:hypothetical protein
MNTIPMGIAASIIGVYDVESWVLWKVNVILQDHTASHPRKQQSLTRKDYIWHGQPDAACHKHGLYQAKLFSAHVYSLQKKWHKPERF